MVRSRQSRKESQCDAHLDSRLKAAADLTLRGNYLAASKSLATLPSFSSSYRTILEAEVQWAMGDPNGALLRVRELPRDRRSARCAATALMVEGMALLELGQYGEGAPVLSEALVAAGKTNDQQLCAWLALRVLSATEDRNGPDAVDRQCDMVRSEVVKSGTAEYLALLNCIRGRILAKRGALDTAQRHFDVAAELLLNYPSLYCQGVWELDMSVLSWMVGDIDKALVHAARALRMSGDTGHARTRLAAVGNIGLLRFYRGNPAGATQDLDEVIRASAEACPCLRPAFLESKAQIRLSEGDTEQAEQILGEADEAFAREPAQVKSWYDLAAYPTRVGLALKVGRPQVAVRLLSEAASSARARKDLHLGTQLSLLRAESLLALGRPNDAGLALMEALPRSTDVSLQLLGELERLHGKYLALSGHPLPALEHFDRALRVFLTTGHTAARLDTAACRDAVLASLPPPTANNGARMDPFPLDPNWSARLLSMANYPELLGREAFAFLERTQAIQWAVFCAESGAEQEILLSAGIQPTTPLPRHRRTVRLWLGRAHDRDLLLSFEPHTTFEAEHISWSVQRLVESITAAEAVRQAERARTSLWPAPDEEGESSELGVFSSEAMREVMKTAQQLADTDIPILITGETGCGKEVVGRALHQLSRRAPQSFIPFNCTAVGRELLDSQLFGHRRGAFTGATDHFQGVIRSATGGTLFLDEIGEIGLDVQPKLLRFLESSEVHPLGEGFPQRVDVRVVAATNADVDKMVADGRFRLDLFYRLAPARLRVPPLRQRREEIPALLKRFIRRYSEEYKKQDLTVADEAYEMMLVYSWPGNIRQLMNEVRRLVALAPSGKPISAELLSDEIRTARPVPSPVRPPTGTECLIRLDQPLHKATAQLEAMLISNALSQTGGLVEPAAKRLGISRKGLFLKRRRLKL